MNEIIKDLTTVTEGIVAHGCNCAGGFGSGIAYAIRNKWPIVYDHFKENGTGFRLLGTVDYVDISEELIVANCYTQELYGPPGMKYASYLAIEKCIKEVAEEAWMLKMDLYLPKLGCGLGGLNWEEVSDVYEEVFSYYADVNIYVCDI